MISQYVGILLPVISELRGKERKLERRGRGSGVKGEKHTLILINCDNALQ